MIISTPARLSPWLGHLALRESLETLIIDEADLMHSFGYQEEMTQIWSNISSTCQIIMVSATLSDDLLEMKQTILRQPVGFPSNHHNNGERENRLWSI